MERYQTAQVGLTLLSPVHIGCGDAYDPSCYLIGDDGILYVFEPSLIDLPEAKRNELKRLGQTGAVFDWARFFYRNRDLYVSAARTAMEVGTKVRQLYLSLVEFQRSQNQCHIFRTVYTVDGEDDVAFIPGSSVKGAIHTALAEHINGGRSAAFEGARRMLDIDGRVIGGSFSNSPMRFVKVGDFMPTQAVRKRAVYASRLYKGDAKTVQRAIPASFEVLWPGVYRNYAARWSLLESAPIHNIKHPYRDFRAIARDLNEKMCELFAKECSYLERFEQARVWVQGARRLIETLRPELESGTVALVRLGKNQGASSLVLSGTPSPKAKPKTQFFVTDDGLMLPFGWALLEFEAQENVRIQAWCASQKAVQSIDLTEVRQKRLADQARIQAERQAQELAREAERREQEEKQKRLAALSPQEQALETLVEQLRAFSGTVKSGTELFNAVRALLNDALNWPVDLQKKCAQTMGPLIKSKGMYQGKAEKEFKACLRSLRNEGS